MAKDKKTAASLFAQMPTLNKSDLNPTVKKAEPTPKSQNAPETAETVEEKIEKTSEPVKESKEPEVPVEKTTPEEKPVVKEKHQPEKKRPKKEEPTPSESVSIPLRKDGQKDMRYSESKQSKKYALSLQPELFEEVSALAFKLSSPTKRVAFNTLVIEALEDLLKKYEKKMK